MTEPDRYLSIKEVREQTSLSTATIYRLVESGELERQVRITKGRVAWRASAIERWKASHPPG